MKNRKTIIIFTITFLVFCFWQNAFGASLEIKYPNMPFAPDINNIDSTKADLPSYVLYIFYFVVYISGITAMVMLAIGGVKYFLSAGNVSKMVEAKNQLISALIGLTIMLGSYAILYNINPQLVIINPKEPIKVPGYTQLVANEAPSKLQSSIYTEIPIGGAIERMLEIRKLKDISESPNPSASPAPIPADKDFQDEENEVPRMQRITNVSENILALSEKLKSANKSLKSFSENCSCGQVGLESEFTPIQCSPSPSPSPIGLNTESLGIKLAQSEGEEIILEDEGEEIILEDEGEEIILDENPLPELDENSGSPTGQNTGIGNACPDKESSKFCNISCNTLKEVLDTDLAFSVDFKDKLNDASKPTIPGCWAKTKRDFLKGDSSLSAGSFTVPITGTTTLSTIVSQKGYFSFSYKTTARDASCVCGPTKSIFGLLYLCGKDAENKAGLENKFLPTGLELKIDGNLDYRENAGLDNIFSGSLFYSKDWKEIKVLAEANTRFSFEFSSSAGNPCFYAEIDNVKFVPYDEEKDAPSPSPTPIDGCSCDPCKSFRSQISQTQNEITEIISGGTKIDGKDKYGYDKEIKTSLTEQQSKARKEIRLIQDEIGKLDRMEEFMLECGLSNLITLSEYLDLADEYDKDHWILDTANFWDYIKSKGDWATFYCPVSGTLWEGIDPLKIKAKSDLTQEEADILRRNPTEDKPSSRELLGSYDGLVNFKKFLAQVESEILQLNGKLKANETAKPKDKLSDEEIKDINAKLVLLNARKKELEDNIKEADKSIKEIDAEIAVIKAHILPYQVLQIEISLLNPALLANSTTYQGFSATLRAKYKNNPEKLKELEKSLEITGNVLGATNPIIAIDKIIKDDKDALAELEASKAEIMFGIAGGNTGEESIGKEESEIGSLFEGEVAAACNREIPMGELIDRSRRVGYKIVERLETLVSLSEELMKKTSDLEILVSQCSSKRCKPVCVNTENPSPTPTPTPPEITPTPSPIIIDDIPRYECGTSENHVMCKYSERCLSTKDGPKCYLNTQQTVWPHATGQNCGNPLSQIYCNSDYPYCMRTESDVSRDEESNTTSSLYCCDTGACGNWGNQICLPKNTFCVIGKDAEGKETPDSCNINEEKACGKLGNQICCPRTSGCGLGEGDKPFCGGSSTLDTWATSSICGEPGYQIKCEQPTKYCSGTSTNPTCTSDPNFQKRTDSAYKEMCVYAFTDYSQYIGNNDIYHNLGKQCNGVLSFTGYIQSATDYGPSATASGGTPRIHESSNPAILPSSVCTDCCEYPNKACGVISPWKELNVANPSIWGSFTSGPCCKSDDTCINPANSETPNGFPSTCCPKSSVVCGEKNKQVCCDSDQKCGTQTIRKDDGSLIDPYCIDDCIEPPQQSFCESFNAVVDSRNIIWQDEDMNFLSSHALDYQWWLREPHLSDKPFWTWSHFYAKGFYAQTTEYYTGERALMASIKNDKTVLGKSFSPDHTTIAGKFNVKGKGSIQFYYKTSKYYNPSITPLKVACKIDTFKVDANNNALLRDCFPGEITLEPSAEWKKIEIPVPENAEYDSRLNGLVLFSFNPLAADTFIPNDDCVWVALDKIEYSGTGSGTCEGKPCPEEEIQNTLNDIIAIVDGKAESGSASCPPYFEDGKMNPDYPDCGNKNLKEREGIRDIVNGSYKPSDNKTKAEQVGIKALISEIVPTIYSDLNSVRNSMKSCFYAPTGKAVVQNCEMVKNELGPDNKLIKNCCYKECYMQDCLSSCYLKENHTKYKNCLFSCLTEQQSIENRNSALAEKISIKDIDSCRYSLNFYCCSIK